jgi:hypothetical protein
VNSKVHYNVQYFETSVGVLYSNYYYYYSMREPTIMIERLNRGLSAF